MSSFSEKVEPNSQAILDALQHLIEVVAKLRSPEGGCPWDLEQTQQTLIPYIIEEAYETVHAIKSQDQNAIAIYPSAIFNPNPMLETLQLQLYSLEQFANTLVSFQLIHLNWLSFSVILMAGLLTSLTPCMLSMLPLTVAYIGGYQNQGRFQSFIQSSWFALGLATTLAGLGIIAATVGRVYGQIGVGLPIIVSMIAILMGLNLLELLPIRFPSLGTTDWIKADFPEGLRSYLLGLTFGLVASPCSTPVLASLLAWVASSQDLLLGAGLLLAYTIGYVMPLILVGAFTGSLKKLLELRQWSSWINPVSGTLLIGFGAFSLLSRLPKF